jgi:membrane protease YdiL (CAAX protease family)
LVITIVGIIIFIAFTIWIHLGPYPSESQPKPQPIRDAIEAIILIILLLALPFFNLKLLWLSGWLGVYFLAGVLLPIVFERLIRRRSFSIIGLRRPSNRKVILITTILLVIILISRLAQPGFFRQFSWRVFLTNSIFFAFIEEMLFRGLIQTRLRSFLGDIGAWMGSGLFFGFYHFFVHYLVQQKTPSLEEVFSLFFITTLGLLLGVIFAKTKSLLPTFLIHMVNNL